MPRSTDTSTRWLQRLGLAAGFLLAACGTTSSTDAEKSPERDALERSDRRIREARQQSVTATERAGPYQVRVRLNPPDCHAPPFEIRAHGRWERAWLAGTDSTRATLEQLRSPATPVGTAHETFRVTGEYTDTRRADTGRTYPVFQVSSITSDFSESVTDPP